MSEPADVLEFRTDVPLIQYIVAFGFSCFVTGFFLLPHWLEGAAPPTGDAAIGTLGLTACLGVAGFRRGVALDRARGEVRRMLGWFFVRRTARAPLAAFSRIEVRSSTYQSDRFTASRSDQRITARETSYPVYLAGDRELMVCTNGTHASSMEDAQRIASFLGLPVDDLASAP
jgi:hypothetical protein